MTTEDGEGDRVSVLSEVSVGVIEGPTERDIVFETVLVPLSVNRDDPLGEPDVDIVGRPEADCVTLIVKVGCAGICT